MALFRCGAASAAYSVYDDITASFTTQNVAGQYNRILANADIDYEMVIIYGTTDSTGAINTNMSNDDILFTTLSSGTAGLQCSVVQNVKSGDYLGRSTGSGTTSSWKVIGVK